MLYRQSWINRLERKLGWFAVQNLMLIIVGAMGIVYIMDYLIGAGTGQSIISMLTFDRALIAEGQIWRIFTFIFLPPPSSLLFIIFALYFYYLIGSTLEGQWGSFGFTLYYFSGIIFNIIAGLISGFATNDYLNMSLFLAFALLNPNFTVMLFFIIPVKMKWLAVIDALGIVFMFVMSGFSGKLAVIASILNLLIFFAPNFIDFIKSVYRRIKWNRKFK